MDTRNIGLRNIEVADTKICSIDGENGKLIYRGYDIFDLVNHSTFEETSYLLLFGDLPDKDNLQQFSEQLSSAREHSTVCCRQYEEQTKSSKTYGCDSIDHFRAPGLRS